MIPVEERAHMTQPSEITVALKALKAKSSVLYLRALHAAEVAKGIAGRIDLPGDVEPNELYQAGLLHDIGLLSVPDMILGKCSLTEEERSFLFHHPIAGAEFVEAIPKLAKFKNWILQHHEMADGSGYPNRLKLEQIEVPSRILNVASSFAIVYVKRPDDTEALNLAIVMLSGTLNSFFGNKANAVAEYLQTYRRYPHAAHSRRSH